MARILCRSNGWVEAGIVGAGKSSSFYPTVAAGKRCRESCNCRTPNELVQESDTLKKIRPQRYNSDWVIHPGVPAGKPCNRTLYSMYCTDYNHQPEMPNLPSAPTGTHALLHDHQPHPPSNRTMCQTSYCATSQAAMICFTNFKISPSSIHMIIKRT
jgi:hypothetical protein